MYFSKFMPLTAAMMLSACVVTQDQATMSRFTNPTSSGHVPEILNNKSQVAVIDFQGDGYAYASGSITNEGILAVSGLVSGTSGGSLVSGGTATYTGNYELLRISNINISGGYISASQAQRTGSISLAADFDNGTLTGQSGSLIVNGTVTGTGLSGGVSFEGVSGDLTGVIGSSKAVGAFHGNNAHLIYSGGFLVY